MHRYLSIKKLSELVPGIDEPSKRQEALRGRTHDVGIGLSTDISHARVTFMRRTLSLVDDALSIY